MEITQLDDCTVIDSQYEELGESEKIEETGSKINIYKVCIKPSKREFDLSIMENQFYDFQVKKQGQSYRTVQRRFSEFALIYEILCQQYGGYIFPAFPENGIFTFMKTKVTMIKDEELINRRIKVIERFFNQILNDPIFDPDTCNEMKQFLSNEAFKARKNIQKTNKGMFNFSWSKLKTYFINEKDSKYEKQQERISKLKLLFENLYTNCRLLIECMKEESKENLKFLEDSYTKQFLKKYSQLIQKHSTAQKTHQIQLEKVQFDLFCESEDLQMVKNIFDKISELSNDQENYSQLKAIEERLSKQLQKFIVIKSANRQKYEEKLRSIIEQIKKQERMINKYE